MQYTCPKTSYAIPVYADSVAAGFPSPAQDYIENALDLHELLIARPAATYFVRVSGDSMIEAGILEGDILIVDKSVKAQHGDTVVANVDDSFTVKVLAVKPQLKLIARNPDYPAITIKEGMTLDIFGVVTGVIRQLKRR